VRRDPTGRRDKTFLAARNAPPRCRPPGRAGAAARISTNAKGPAPHSSAVSPRFWRQRRVSAIRRCVCPFAAILILDGTCVRANGTGARSRRSFVPTRFFAPRKVSRHQRAVRNRLVGALTKSDGGGSGIEPSVFLPEGVGPERSNAATQNHRPYYADRGFESLSLRRRVWLRKFCNCRKTPGFGRKCFPEFGKCKNQHAHRHLSIRVSLWARFRCPLPLVPGRRAA
jgi:hypothetical protein